ncbi:MAG: hypothetical protein ACFBSE_25125 [Prochloraceae cyanobacterium]
MNEYFVSNNSEELIEKIREHYNNEGKPLSKSQAYKRLDKAGVKAHKENGRCWLDREQFLALEALEKHIKSGGSMDTFGAMILQEQNKIENQDRSQELNEIIPEEILLLDRRAQEKAAGILIAQNYITSDYLNNWQLLDEDLKKEVRETRIASYPQKIDPKKLAETVIAAVRKNRKD